MLEWVVQIYNIILTRLLHINIMISPFVVDNFSDSSKMMIAFYSHCTPLLLVFLESILRITSI
jgi:hypothetical protein